MKHSLKWVSLQSSGVKRAWAAGKYEASMRHQSPELIERRIRGLRGKRRSPEVIEMCRERTASAWKAGKYSGLKGSSAEHMRAMRKKIDVKKMASENRQRLLGTHGKGLTAEHNPNHFQALHWVIRDDRGVVYEFNNLRSWCRKNEFRFFPDERPKSKLPLWKRAIGGFNSIRFGQKGQLTWRGWTLVTANPRQRSQPTTKTTTITQKKK